MLEVHASSEHVLSVNTLLALSFTFQAVYTFIHESLENDVLL